MLRTDSQGAITSHVHDTTPSFADLAGSPPQDDKLSIQIDTPVRRTTITPPTVLPANPGHQVIDIDMDATPTPNDDAHFELDSPTRDRARNNS